MEISDHSPNYTLTSEGTRDIFALIVAAEENNLSTFDFNEGTCNYYEIDSVKTDWVEQELVQ